MAEIASTWTRPPTSPVRSALFVPANRGEWVAKAPRYGADALVLDLEDATPPDRKEEARAIVRESLPLLADQAQGTWVRVNDLTSRETLADLDAVCRPGVEVICLPKVRGAEDVRELDRLLGYFEGRNDLKLGTIGILPLLETATALHDPASVFAASPRVRYAGAIAAPDADVAFAVGFTWTDTFMETHHLRSAGLLAARACGIENPITGLVITRDRDPVRRFAEMNKTLGYEGLFVIHPTHVEIANEVFSPSEAEYAWSEEVLTTYTAAREQGRGAILDSAGRMIDMATVKVAERTAQRYRHHRERDLTRGQHGQ